jgi:ubiquinone/menaquinone biosynthesis C-methylase UbiE
MKDIPDNLDPRVTTGFGHEWATFRQGEEDLSASDRVSMFNCYFHIFPWEKLSSASIGLDAGCGSGRWSMLVAPRVGHLHLLDASAEALDVARSNLEQATNVTFHLASLGDIPLPAGSLDFAFSLGVLHHMPDTRRAIREIASKLRGGAPFLVYLYYAFDNRPAWFRGLWRLSNLARIVISRLPATLRLIVSQIIAATVYWPLAHVALLAERLGFATTSIPLEWYRHYSFYVMRTDAYDRFCTSLEQRFTRRQIEQMLLDGGFCEIRFSEQAPFWCAVATRCHD